jgi:hypothetical protein
MTVGKLKVAINVDKSIKKIMQGELMQSKDFDIVRGSVQST